MSVSLEESSSLTTRFRDALPSIWKESRNTQIWGVDMEHTELQVLEVILEKFLESHSALPVLQVQRAISSLQKTLEWRRVSDPETMLTEVGPVLSDLNLCRITLNRGHYVLWVSIDDMDIKQYSAIHPLLTTTHGLVQLGLAVMEKLSTVLLHAVASPDLHDHWASCVIEFKLRPAQKTRKERQFFKKTLCKALEELVTLIRYHYPNILGKAFIINSRDEYLASLDIDEALLRNTVLLKKPEDLARHLGSELPPQYGGNGEAFAESDFLHFHCSPRQTERSISIEKSDINAAESSETEMAGAKTEITPSTKNTDLTCPEDLETEEQNLRLIYSEAIGPPSIILDPVDLEKADDLCPDKMGARIAFADSDTLVKFGHGVRLAEAEALHLASTRTTIAVPKLLSAYILDDVGYIVMSYERGEPLHKYWDHASNAEQNRILETLRDYVNQMRDISGDFIGAVDGSPCRDGIFEAGYGDYTKYSYGPYPSEESFDEGIIQALRDRIRPKVLEREHDIESNFFNSEYMLYQTVRGLKNHKIVFTHGDLHTGNMIVRSDGTVVLLDWGLAGFWPEYWEFYRAMHTPSWRTSWDRMVEKFIPPFYVEYHVMKWVFGTVWN